MKNQIVILIGLALLICVGAGYYFNKNKYFNSKSGLEIPKNTYDSVVSKESIYTEWHFNIEAGLTAGVAFLGLGLVLTGMFNKNKTLKF